MALKDRIQAVEKHAERLMDELGRRELGVPLQARGWTFGFDRAKRRLGLCVWKKAGRLERRISISRPYAALFGLDRRDETGLQVMDDVIRHEIAHAIDYERYGSSSHGPRWKAICERLGADPSRVYETTRGVRLPGRYVATCPGCGAELDYYRRPERDRACAECCRRYNGGRYTARYRLVLAEREGGRRVAYGRERREAAAVTPSGSKRPTPTPRGAKYTGRCRVCGFERGYRRKLKRVHACPHCCKRHAGGRFDEAYALEITRNY